MSGGRSTPPATGGDTLKKLALGLGLPVAGKTQDQLAAGISAAVAPSTALKGDGPVLLIDAGDEITLGNTDPAQLALYPGQRGGAGYAFLAAVKSGGRLRLGRNAGVTGQTSQGLLDRLYPDVLRSKPQLCTVLIGSNDVAQGIAASVTAANIALIARACQENGVLPVLCTVPPRAVGSGFQAGVSALNTAIRALGTSLGVPVADFYAALADPGTGAFITGTTSDDLRPNGVGAGLMADVLLTTLAPLLSSRSHYASRSAGDVGNLLPNPLLSTVSATPGLPQGYAVTGTAGVDRTLSLAADPAFAPGNALSITRLNTTATTVSLPSVPAGAASFLPGDKLAFSAAVSVVPVTRGGVTWSAVAALTGSGESVGFPVAATGTVTAGRLFAELTVPPGTTSLDVTLSFTGGPGTVRLADVTLTNLSAAGAAPRPMPVQSLTAGAAVSTAVRVALLSGNATLPTAASYANAAVNSGRVPELIVKNTTNAAITVTPAGTETIDGQSGAYTVPAKSALSLLAQFQTWYVI